MEIALWNLFRIVLGLVIGLWIGSRLAARKFTSTANEPYGVEWRGKVYDVYERELKKPVE